MPKFYAVTFSVTGHGSATVEADSQEEADEKAKDYDIVLGSELLHEWEVDEINGVEFDYEEDADD